MSHNSKKVQNVVGGVNESAPEALTLKSVAAPPVHGSPLPPGGFEPLTKDEVNKLSKLQKTQRVQLGAAVSELVRLEAKFGHQFPEIGALLTVLRRTDAWSEERDKAKAWAVYASAQALLAGDLAEKQLGGFRSILGLIVKRDPSIEASLKTVESLMGGWGASADRGVATKRKAPDKPPTPATGESTPASPSKGKLSA